jgi:hypothetical protein
VCAVSATAQTPEPWWSSQRFARVAFALTVLGLLSGGAAWLAGRHHLADHLWQAMIVLVLLPLALDIAASLRRRELGVEAIALLAMAGALAFGENLAGAVVALMLSGGEIWRSTPPRGPAKSSPTWWSAPRGWSTALRALEPGRSIT